MHFSESIVTYDGVWQLFIIIISRYRTVICRRSAATAAAAVTATAAAAAAVSVFLSAVQRPTGQRTIDSDAREADGATPASTARTGRHR